MESLTEEQEILEAASLIFMMLGIKGLARGKFGSSNGKLQEQEGPAVAKEMLEELGYEPDTIGTCMLSGSASYIPIWTEWIIRYW